jgi:hypothetical protein
LSCAGVQEDWMLEQDTILCPKCIELPPIAKKVDLPEQKRKTKLPICHFNDRIPPNFLCSALLWHRLMGTKVLATTFSGTNKIRAYAHCAKDSVSNSPFSSATSSHRQQPKKNSFIS